MSKIESEVGEVENLHISVMLTEVLASIEGKKISRVLDGTCGAGGHSIALLEAHSEIRELVASDQDETALAIAGSRLAAFTDKVRFVRSNFCALNTYSDEKGEGVIGPFDYILLDIGVSSMQIDSPDRGFSFRFDAPLDMRMNQEEWLTAEEVVNSYPKDELARIIYEYGEERASRKIALKIFEYRKKKRIMTTHELAEIVESVVPRRGKIHPATKTFQAIRMEVNHELDVLKNGILHLSQLLAPGGLFAIITFHSGEDRIVKQLFKELTKNDEFSLLYKKPLVPSHEEMRSNPRSRSAKFRVLQRM